MKGSLRDAKSEMHAGPKETNNLHAGAKVHYFGPSANRLERLDKGEPDLLLEVRRDRRRTAVSELSGGTSVVTRLLPFSGSTGTDVVPWIVETRTYCAVG